MSDNKFKDKIQIFDSKVSDKQKQLRIDNKLPQIILPKNKLDMFYDWYNEDLRFTSDLPEAYNEGYMIIENDIIQVKLEDAKDYIKQWAKHHNTTYRVIENRLKEYIADLDKVTLYFKYTNKHIDILMYGKSGYLATVMNFDVCEGENSRIENKHITKFSTWEDIQNEFNFLIVTLFVSSIWYIATTSKTTRYYYEEKRDRYTYTDKEVKNVSKHKTISTPVYDLTKIKTVKIESLVKRRKGWTYSHSFQVHGHYRHYKSGKVIFVNPFIKGKNKELQEQIITLNPKEL